MEGAGPVVLVSGGVGLTRSSACWRRASRCRPTAGLVGARHPDGAVHAFGERGARPGGRRSGLRRHVVYEAPRAQDRAGHDYDAAGRIDAEWLARHTPLAEATVYLCGPRPFLHALGGGLLARGVPRRGCGTSSSGPPTRCWASGPGGLIAGFRHRASAPLPARSARAAHPHRSAAPVPPGGARVPSRASRSSNASARATSSAATARGSGIVQRNSNPRPARSGAVGGGSSGRWSREAFDQREVAVTAGIQ